MNNRVIVIPSATLVPEELQNLGKLPAIIYPVNQRIVFDYLYSQYSDKCSLIKVATHVNHEKVLASLSSYVTTNLEVYKIPDLKDLGHTIYYSIDGIACPIIINLADTIVLEDSIPDIFDFIYYSEDAVSDTWTFYREADGVITDIIDKKENEECYTDTEKLVVGVFGISDPQYFRKCLELAFVGYDESMSTFYYALKLYSQKYSFVSIHTSNWFDIGHADTYYNSRLEVKAREFNHISIDKDRGILRKTSDDKDKFIGEIKWYLKLPSDIEYVRPRIFDYSISYIEPYISMEYYAYHTIHELFLYGDLSDHQWTDVFKRICFILNDFKRYTVKDRNVKLALQDMYLMKTLQRLERMKEDEKFKAFFQNQISINGVLYKSLDEVCSVLKELVPIMLYDVEEFTIIHGDLCFANMMVDNNFSFIKVIDPRGKFGSYDIYGDQRYELAKLFHSVDGKYDFIIKDLFDIVFDLNDARMEYQIHVREREFDLYHIFTKVFKNEIGNNLKKIELIEALLFLSMIPLHGESIKHQMVMLGTGLEILNRVIDITI